jgi:hypothetical protein
MRIEHVDREEYTSSHAILGCAICGHGTTHATIATRCSATGRFYGTSRGLWASCLAAIAFFAVGKVHIGAGSRGAGPVAVWHGLAQVALRARTIVHILAARAGPIPANSNNCGGETFLNHRGGI